MSDIKSVLSLLCQHLNLSINVMIKPEHFRLAKFNNAAENVNEILWTALDTLSLHALREKRIDIDVQEYSAPSAVKLALAYLQYPVIEFYAQNESNNNSRQLLLAFAWLLGTQDVLNIVMRTNIGNSPLGRECTSLETTEKKEISECSQQSLSTLVNTALHINGKVNYNIKEISELLSEKAKLINKVHTASINVSGLPHLSVSELALMKRICTANKDTYTSKDGQQLKDLSNIGTLIDTHMKWVKKEHIFFEWMVTVVEEHRKSISANISTINWQEVLKFVSLLRRIIKDRFEVLSSKELSNKHQDYQYSCVSRLLRTQDTNTELGSWLKTITERLAQETEDLTIKREELSAELKEILQLIPSCVQV